VVGVDVVEQFDAFADDRMWRAALEQQCQTCVMVIAKGARLRFFNACASRSILMRSCWSEILAVASVADRSR